MNAPHQRTPSPHTIVRHTLIPPQPATLQAANAWRGTVRPHREPHAPLRHLAALALCVAALSVFVWTLHAGASPEPTQIIVRAATR